MLADSIDGGILMILFLFGGPVAALLALFALVPAWRGDWSSTFILAGPAFVCGLAVTLCFTCGYIKDDIHEPRNFFLLWVIMAGPAITTSLLAVFVLWFRRARMKQTN